MATSAEEVDGDQDKSKVTEERVPDSWSSLQTNDRASTGHARVDSTVVRVTTELTQQAPIEGFETFGPLTDASV
jgi:hypothetical protein